MKAAFAWAIRWQIEAVCRSPLRTAGVDGDTESVLRSHTGRALLQGSSLAGSIRSWLENSGYPEEALKLFGDQKTSGSLYISDGVFSPESEMVIRPRLKIDGAAGTAEDKKKFDVAHIGTGSSFAFHVVWTGSEEGTEVPALETALGALHRGEITLGAQRSNGFGRVELRVLKRCFDLREDADREAWLEDAEGDEELALPAARSRYVVFTATGTADSLLVKASQPVQLKGKDKGSYTENIREAGMPVLPGSSIKGALRARAEMTAKYLGLSEALTEDVFGSTAAGAGEQGKPGRLRVSEVSFPEPERIVTRIRINKFTGGVMRQGLFKEQPVSGDVRLQVEVDRDCPAGCALILFALRDLGLGFWNLGSGGAVGRGRLRLRELRAEMPEGETLLLRFSENEVNSAEDPSGLAERWLSALKEAGR